MSMKQILTAVICIVILAASTLLLGRGCDKTVHAPDDMWNRPQTLIDLETLELVTKPLGEWGEMDNDGRYQNDAGKYTMVLPLPCPHCGELVPPIVYRDYTQIGAERANWTCPKCGKKGL